MGIQRWYVRRGRLSRRDLWGQYLVPLMLLTTVAALVDGQLGYPEPVTHHWSVFTYSGGPVSLVVLLLTIVPSVSSTVARLHDRGHSARWLLWLLLPVLGWFLVVIETSFFRGDPVPNAYGPPEERFLAYA
jgi:uncharacterized membrane protein YhaH (DUF805 family)